MPVLSGQVLTESRFFKRWSSKRKLTLNSADNELKLYDGSKLVRKISLESAELRSEDRRSDEANKLVIVKDQDATIRFKAPIQPTKNSKDDISCAADWMAALQGVVGKLGVESFDVIGKLGRGGYGSVLLCEHIKHSTICALKRIPKGIPARQAGESDRDLKRRMAKEGRKIRHLSEELTALKALAHPSLARFYYSFQDAGAWYIASEFFARGDMYRFLKRMPNRRFPEPVVKFWMAQLVSILEAVHHRGVVHRDLKPENLLLDDNGCLKLIDFGLCKHLRPGERTETLCGTKYYMAPEMIEGKGWHAFSVDWWAVGVLTFELLTGYPPFTCKHLKTLYRDIVHHPFAFPEDQPISADARDFINNMLKKSPTERLGCTGSARHHRFFDGIDWKAIDGGRPEESMPVELFDLLEHFPPQKLAPSHGFEEDQETARIFHPDMDMLDNFSFNFMDFRGDDGMDSLLSPTARDVSGSGDESNIERFSCSGDF